MPTPLFDGVAVALVTLFDDDGALDAPATGALAARLVEVGVRAVVVAGTTGEASALRPEERDELLAAVRSAVGGAVPVIAGTGAASAGEAKALTAAAVAGGADGVLALSPPGPDDLVGYYEAVATGAGDVPVLAYHFPAVSPPGIPVEALDPLPVAGVKDSSGDPERLLAELDAFARPVYTGSSALLSFAGPLGCTGAILGLANAEPERCAEAFAGDAAAQRALTPAHLASRRTFPASLKQMVAERFGVSPACRVV